MGTGLTFHGQDTDVVLDDRTITLVDTATSSTAGATGRSGDGGPVVILRSEVTAVELEPPTLLAYGRLVISTRAGTEHTVQFPRPAQEHFENLEAIVRP
jgi:hypothetical protein